MEPYDVLRALSLIIVWAIPALLVVGVVALVITMPALIAGGAILRLSNIVSAGLRRKPQVKTQAQGMTCAIDTDCPLGYVCMAGHCVPQT